MSKRVAAYQMTHDNWDQEEEAEEAGHFSVADEDTLKKREIKIAKRRTAAGAEAAKGGAFKGFSGFGAAKKTPQEAFGKFTGFNQSSDVSSVSNGISTTTTESSSNKPKDGKASKEDYHQNLKALNECVSNWIKKHVDKNPYCILTPIFKDYERHLAEIEKSNVDKKDGESEKTDKQKDEVTETKAESSSKPTFSFGISKSSNGESSSSKDTSSTTDKPASTGFTFGTTDSISNSSGSGIKLGSDSGFKFSSTSTSGFSFGTTTAAKTDSSKPFTFAVTSKPTTSTNQESDSQKEDEEYQPPKPESVEVKEEGSVYSIRCKLFYQKEGSWVEKGVGFIHLKPIQDDKTQLIIRADTNLGNILLNVLLTSSVPISRQGKSNVTFVCIPSPPINPKDKESKPATLLVKVKTENDAEELFAKMNELKK